MNLDPETGIGEPLRFVTSELSEYRHTREWWKLGMEIADGLLDGSLDVAGGEQMIRATDSILKCYPGLEVPPKFIEDRPNVIFAPPSISPYKSYRGPIYGRLEEFGMGGLSVTNLQELRRVWLLVLPLLNTPDINPENAKHVLARITCATYLSNLELYRLTMDAEGTVVRFARERSGPGRFVALDKYEPSLPDKVCDLTRGKYITFWYRKDARGDGKFYPGRKMVIKGLRELEADHFIALDPAEDSAIVTISKS